MKSLKPSANNSDHNYVLTICVKRLSGHSEYWIWSSTAKNISCAWSRYLIATSLSLQQPALKKSIVFLSHKFGKTALFYLMAKGKEEMISELQKGAIFSALNKNKSLNI